MWKVPSARCGWGVPNTFWLSLTRSHVSCMLYPCAERHRQHHCSHNCLNAVFGYKLSGSRTMVLVGCILTRVASPCLVTLRTFALGIVHTFFYKAPHQSNGVAERRIGELTTGIRYCQLRSALPHHLWVEATMHVARAQNLLPSQRVPSSGFSGTNGPPRKNPSRPRSWSRTITRTDANVPFPISVAELIVTAPESLC